MVLTMIDAQPEPCQCGCGGEAKPGKRFIKAHHIVTAEAKEKLSAARKGKPASNRGVPHSQETRAKISAARRGRYWKGDNIGYTEAHHRHDALLPKACAHCGKTYGRLDVALRHDVPAERVRVDATGSDAGKSYSLFVGDYIRLCRSCHKSYDNRHPRAERVA
jgi:hypothetical protein